MSSKRLPGKALINIGSNPLLWHVIERAKLCKNAKHIIVATSTEQSDDEIENYCGKLGITCFRGSLNNLVERAYQTMIHFGLENFARVCGDRILLDYKSIDAGFELIDGFDLVSNKSTSPPPGLTTEVLSKNALYKLLNKNLSDSHLEHLTSYIYDTCSNWKIKKLATTPLFSRPIRMVIDDQSDLIKYNEIIQNLEQKLGKSFHQEVSYEYLSSLIL